MRTLITMILALVMLSTALACATIPDPDPDPVNYINLAAEAMGYDEYNPVVEYVSRVFQIYHKRGDRFGEVPLNVWRLRAILAINYFYGLGAPAICGPPILPNSGDPCKEYAFMVAVERANVLAIIGYLLESAGHPMDWDLWNFSVDYAMEG